MQNWNSIDLLLNGNFSAVLPFRSGITLLCCVLWKFVLSLVVRAHQNIYRLLYIEFSFFLFSWSTIWIWWEIITLYTNTIHTEHSLHIDISVNTFSKKNNNMYTIVIDWSVKNFRKPMKKETKTTRHHHLPFSWMFIGWCAYMRILYNSMNVCLYAIYFQFYVNLNTIE